MTKTRDRYLLAAICLLSLGAMIGNWRPAHAQVARGDATGPAPVQQSTTHADAATNVGNSSTSAATITFAARAGLSFYLTAIDITSCDSAAVTTPALSTITTTNLTGSPVWITGQGTAAGGCNPTINTTWPTGLKSAAAGVATTIVLPTFATNQTINVNAYGFYGL